MAVEDAVIPFVIFSAIVAIVFIVMRFRTERMRINNAGAEGYRKLAEEAVTAQKGLVEEVQRMNTTLREIEKLLREV